MKLSERVERLEGPDREIDFAIGEVVIGLRHVGDDLYDTDSPSGPYYSEDGGDYPAYPRYTASLDAAMSLVPEGANSGDTVWNAEGWAGNGVHAPHVRATAWVVGASRVYAATPAIALCAAALKSRGL